MSFFRRRQLARVAIGIGALVFGPQSRAEVPPVRGPAPYRSLSAAEAEQYRRGQVAFSTHWVAAGTPDAKGRSGVGPLFNADSCDSCHNGAARGQGAIGDGPAPAALVVKLEAPPTLGDAEPAGDPVYGRIFNTTALAGVPAEGAVVVEYREITGSYYPGGGYWRMREPIYHLMQLRYGPLASTTVIKPRLAPALFGLGFLEAVPESAITDEAVDVRVGGGPSGKKSGASPFPIRQVGRFGWQSNSISIRDQTSKALALEMGLTSSDRPHDDCTPTQTDCLRSPSARAPEVPDDTVAAIVGFLNVLAAPQASPSSRKNETGRRVFSELGCEACHVPRLTVEMHDGAGAPSTSVVAPYTDLRRHDLGPRMADRDVSGQAVPTKWRTAPLWGLGYRISPERTSTYLHDGRARTTEEAVLWHLGEAATSQRRFRELSPGRRDALLSWLDSL